MRRGRIEIVTVGLNPNLQLIGSDPSGGPYDLGLFIGANANSTAPNLRQLFILAAKRFNAGQRGRLVGFRQYLTMGVQTTSSTPGATYPLERPVETPTWKYVDGNVLWGIRQIPPETHFQPNALNAEGLAFEYSQTPAQLFESIAGGIITPPYGGNFPGNVLTPELGRMFDLRCRRWSKPVVCDVPFEGPCDIAFFASVQQTNPATRTAPPIIPCQNPIPVSAQFNGNDPLPANSAIEHWYVVTTTGPNASIGQLLFDNGTDLGTVTVLTMMNGQSIIPSTNFTGGTISLVAGQVYTWNGTGFSLGAQHFVTTHGTTPEDAFLQNYPGSTYFRIAGALIFEMEEQAPTGAPKTYRRPGDADRITRDTTQTGDNTMRRSAEDTSEYKAAKDGEPQPPKRPQSPPHVSGALGALPKSEALIVRLTDRWRLLRAPGKEPDHINRHQAPSLPTGLGSLPQSTVDGSETSIGRLLKKWRHGKGAPE